MTLERKSKIAIGFSIGFILLAAKLFVIQLTDPTYKQDAEANSLVYEDVFASRGRILDRNRNILVDNSVEYDVYVTPRSLGQFDTLELAAVLDTSADYVRSKMEYYRKYRTRIGFQSTPFLKKISQQTYNKFAEVEYKFDGFSVKMHSVRNYPVNTCGNLLGYVSEVDENYMEKHPGEYKPGDYAGKTGIEAAREKDLRGEKGYHVYMRDSRNRIKGPYKNGEMDKDAVPGNDVVTTIDMDLQKYGQELMQNKVGSVVAIEPSTGEILAMISSPGIDVDKLSSMNLHYREISADPYKPMFNRTVQAPYPPGSVFKLVNGLIGLQEGVLTPRTCYPCYNGYNYGPKKLGCHSHPSPLNLEQAVMMSCNSYFCYVFKDLIETRKYGSTAGAFDVWREYVTSFGLGDKLGCDLPSELGGNIPTSKYYNKIYGKNGWKFSTIISLSIGQGEIGLTPLQIANISAIVANRGYYYIPHIVKGTGGQDIDSKYKERHYTKVDTTQFPKVIKGMWKAVNMPPGSGGTAWVAAVPGLDICGKTGTAQNPRGDHNSVFLCFAPMDNPKIAIAVYVENAGFGATWACPIASLMVEKYLTGTVSGSRLPLEERVMTANLMHKVKTN